MDLDAIAVFVKVVQAGSFTQAARLLGMPNTTVSAKVARLEERLGVTLIRRTTRKLHITPAGQAYFERCVRGLAEIEAADAEVSSGTAEPKGVLRITVPGDVAHSLLPPIVARYAGAHPRTKIEIIVANRVVDLIGEGVDLALRATGGLKDSTLVARRFLPFFGGLWASPDHLARHGVPRRPEELKQHACIAFSRLSREALRLTDGRQKIDLALEERIAADDTETLCALALEGEGIAPLPSFLARGHEAGGRLVHVLPQWTWVSGELSFVYPSQPFVPANIRAFIDVALGYAQGLRTDPASVE
jgi:DNA-binding transcriptional LysR family regulator